MLHNKFMLKFTYPFFIKQMLLLYDKIFKKSE